MGTNYYAVHESELPREDDEWLGEDVGVHLTKTSNGWVPSLQEHRGCICSCSEPPYTDWESFKTYIRQEHIIVIDTYWNRVDAEELIGKMLRFRDEFGKSMRDVEPDKTSDSGSGFAMMSGIWS